MLPIPEAFLKAIRGRSDRQVEDLSEVSREIVRKARDGTQAEVTVRIRELMDIWLESLPTSQPTAAHVQVAGELLKKKPRKRRRAGGQ